jgi:hypothetical protein
MGEMRNALKVLIRKPEGNKPLGNPGIDGKVILEWVLGKLGGKVWIGFIWLIGTRGGLL